MPLKSGASEDTVQSNIKEVYKSFKSKGKIGTSRPANKRAAIRQAVAIAMDKARRSRGRKSHK